MLIIANKLKQLSFSSLMEVYIEGNQEKADSDYSYEPPYIGLRCAEEDLYNYLSECFFKIPGARYAVWEENGRYLSAVRLEPYSDGTLISALETIPSHRGRGYASILLREVLPLLDGPVYSHVGKENYPSIKVHENCGFRRFLDYSVYLDGSVNKKAYTFIFQI